MSKLALLQPDLGYFDAISDEDINDLLSRLEKIAPTLVTSIQPMVNQIQNTLQYAASAGVSRSIFFHPLMLGSYQSLFKDGVIFAVVRKNKRMDVLAAGGRYVIY